MMRLVTTKRLTRLETETRAASEHARQTSGAANAAFARHLRELRAAIERAERAEAATSEVGAILRRALEQVAASEQELLLKAIAVRRLREELAAGPVDGQALTVLFHYGQPHTVYASREDAHADTSTHGYPADHVWGPRGERSPYECRWSCEAFIYSAASKGFRRAYVPSAEPVGGAA
ncbi:hypothetical protein OKJ48_42225 [Streptomyces kunmingensis]|uniref:Uncharacterized protein n=1 Tax=Streptomyces kunmingensis TaxID=68225 RepID=A0ABU6CPY4_9ACTN|nr:hypothetical protein [Streptomyces kunmingensis]MEB3966805.1 hypothetical protein [Streptomyces kunmingensis]